MWQLGPYRIHPTSFSLTRNGEPVAIQRRPLDVLLYLLVHRGRVVSRDQLLEAVWDGLAVSPGAVDQALHEVRTAIGDVGRSRSDRWVETIRGRGFRFRGPAERLITWTPVNDSVRFVGRADQMIALRRAIRRASLGEGGLHLIEGPAGIGKSRLLREAIGAPDGVAVHSAQCERGSPAYYLASELLASLGERETIAGETPTTSKDRSPEDDPSNHFKRLIQIGEILVRASRSQPRVVVIEDLHWADGPSIALLESLAPRLSTLAILVLGTIRSDEPNAANLTRLTGLPLARRIPLGPLGIVDVFQLLESVLGRIPSPDVAGAVLQQSGGIPLYAREIAERMASSDGNPDIASQVGVNIFGQRLAELSNDARTKLAVAALCGDPFDLWVVEAATSSESGEDRSWLEAALDGNLLCPDPVHPRRIRFRHALIRDAAEATLPAGEAARWHHRLGEALAERNPHPDGTVLSAIARHYSAGALAVTDSARPFEYTLRAARAAARQFAWSEVREHARHALDWLDDEPNHSLREERAVEILLLQAASLSSRSDRSEPTDKLLDRAEALLLRVPVATFQGELLSFRVARARADGDHRRGRAIIRAAEELTWMDVIPEHWSRSLDALAGNLFDALASIPESRNPSEPDDIMIEFARRTSRDPAIEGLGLTAIAAWSAGLDREACARSDRAIVRAEHSGDVRGLVWALFLAFLLHELRRDWDRALEVASRIDPLCEGHGIGAWWSSGTGFSLWATCRREANHDFPAGQIASVVADRARSRDTSFRSALLLLATRAYAWSREFAKAQELAREARAFCESTDEKLLLPEILRSEAKLAMVDGDEERSSLQLREACRVARQQGATVPELRALCELERHDFASALERERLEALLAQHADSIGSRECDRVKRIRK